MVAPAGACSPASSLSLATSNRSSKIFSCSSMPSSSQTPCPLSPSLHGSQPATQSISLHPQDFRRRERLSDASSVSVNSTCRGTYLRNSQQQLRQVNGYGCNNLSSSLRSDSQQGATFWGETSSPFLGGVCPGLRQSQAARSQVHRKKRFVSPQAVFQWSKKPEFVGTMPRVIVVTSGKGGVGKTTVTANLGMCLARLEFKVVAIDCDVGLRNLDLLLGLEARVLYTVQDVINGEARLDQALIRDKRCPNFELLCISKPRSKVDLTFSGQSLLLLVETLKQRDEGCPHFILLDCPAGIEAGFITAITPANEAIIVTTPDVTCLRDADRVAGLLECDGISNVKLLVNRVRADLIKAGQMMSVSDVREMLGLPLLGVIPEDSAMIGASNEGMPLVLKKPPAMSGLAIEQAAWKLVSDGEMDTLLLPEEKKKTFGLF
eukprot:TRINITY_DN15918_c0_g1_i1.p1 TRINITY_DN15918_c0_g1~~TRINITY_DN15918_c0_g1_i1.p1  ORF type:complete len:461 (+),score=49.80 TRINITY_DN15918_c0_g1_i1:83-1384(+)